MERKEALQAVLSLRKLRGGSQPILVRASDGGFYVVKFLDNPQGPNLLFNEAVGSELYRQAGLRGPEWQPIYISDEFLDRSPQCWFEMPEGRQRPAAGWAFASRYACLSNCTLFEILPARSFDRVQNRGDFWAAWVLDIFCGHTDNRQALFTEDSQGWLTAHFIDHGHLFGGASGVTRANFRASRYLDGRVYSDRTPQLRSRIEDAIGRLDLGEVVRRAMQLPEGWATDSALENLGRFVERIADRELQQGAIGFVLDEIGASGARHEREPEKLERCHGTASVPAALLQSSAVRGGGQRIDYPAGGRGGRFGETLCGSC